jgi:hypothetical protein
MDKLELANSLAKKVADKHVVRHIAGKGAK